MVLVLLLSVVHAQKGTDYLTGRLGFGGHSLSYTLAQGSRSGMGGYGVEFGYGRFLTNQIGVQLGFGLEGYGSSSTLDYRQVLSGVIDQGGDQYEFRTTYQQWKERQRITYLTIPVEGFYRMPVGSHLGVQLSGGVKIGVPLSGSYQSQGGSFTTSGYYSQWNVELSNLPAYGFDTYSGPYSGSLNPGMSLSGLLEAGCVYGKNKHYDLYVGAYMSYGFNHVLGSTNVHPIYTAQGIYQGLFGSDQTGTVKPVAIGIKVGINWHRIKEETRSSSK